MTTTTRLSPEQADTIRRILIQNQSLSPRDRTSQADLATQFNVNQATISRLARSIRKVDLKKVILELYDKGYNRTQIRNELKVSESYVREVLKDKPSEPPGRPITTGAGRQKFNPRLLDPDVQRLFGIEQGTKQYEQILGHRKTSAGVDNLRRGSARGFRVVDKEIEARPSTITNIPKEPVNTTCPVCKQKQESYLKLIAHAQREHPETLDAYMNAPLVTAPAEPGKTTPLTGITRSRVNPYFAARIRSEKQRQKDIAEHYDVNTDLKTLFTGARLEREQDIQRLMKKTGKTREEVLKASRQYKTPVAGEPGYTPPTPGHKTEQDAFNEETNRVVKLMKNGYFKLTNAEPTYVSDWERDYRAMRAKNLYHFEDYREKAKYEEKEQKAMDEASLVWKRMLDKAKQQHREPTETELDRAFAQVEKLSQAIHGPKLRVKSVDEIVAERRTLGK